MDFRKSGCEGKRHHVAMITSWPRGVLANILSAKAVEGLPLPLEGVHDVHGGDGLTTSVLGVGDGITDDILEEDLEDTAGLLVDEPGDALDATTAGETADGGLGDALDVIAKDFAVALGATLSQSLTSFSASRHGELRLALRLSVTMKIVM